MGDPTLILDSSCGLKQITSCPSLQFPLQESQKAWSGSPGALLTLDIIKIYSPTPLLLALEASPRDAESLGIQTPIQRQ